VSDTPSGLRIVFFGTPQFAAYILEHLVSSGENVVLVVTTSEKEQGRGLKTRPAALQEKAVELGIPFLAPEKVRDSNFIEELKKYEADIYCVVAYKILPKEIYSFPTFSTFNVHTSLLPKYRGAAPMHRAIMNGETVTGITTFLLDDKVDTGSMLLQEKVSISPDENVGELHDDLMRLGAKLALETIRGLASGTLSPKPQDNSLATPAPKIFHDDCKIDFAKPAEVVHNQIRGLSPHPASFTFLPNGERIKVYKARIAKEAETLPSGAYKMSDDKKRLFVGTATMPIELLEIQREGKKRMSAEEFLRGASNLFIIQHS
jgi:methionyl-tRNA formyltransferase